MFFSVLVVAGCPPLSQEASRGFEVIKAIRALTAPGVITISVSQRGKLPRGGWVAKPSNRIQSQSFILTSAEDFR